MSNHPTQKECEIQHKQARNSPKSLFYFIQDFLDMRTYYFCKNPWNQKEL